MTSSDDEEVEPNKARTDDVLEEGRQPDTIDEEAMEADDDAPEPELGLVSSGALLALIRRAIREEGAAKKSAVRSLRDKVRRSP